MQSGFNYYISLCHFTSNHFLDYAITHSLTPFISMQNHYNLVYREEEREMFPTLKHFGVGAIPWSPLARGYVARPLGQQTTRSESDRLIPAYEKSGGSKQIVARIEELANKKGVSMAQIACAWVVNRDGNRPPSVYFLMHVHPHLLIETGVTAPIVGTSSLQNLKDLVGAFLLL